jgi:DNA-directed RNA polymerase subunit RPC12/RpoP
MPSEYYCPRCKSEDVIYYDDHIKCSQCHLSFFIKNLESDIEDENILSEQESSGVVDAFPELKDEETRKKFYKSLAEDLLDEEE